MIHRIFLGLAVTIAMVSGSTAQNNKSSAMDEVVDFASRPQPIYTADFRAKFAQTLANYCQEVLTALPTNTPAEDAWVTAEEKSRNGAKIQRLINSKGVRSERFEKHFYGVQGYCSAFDPNPTIAKQNRDGLTS